MPETCRLVLPRHVRTLPALAVAAALLASLGSPFPAAGDAFETPDESVRAERDRLLTELTAIRAGLLDAVASCREQTASSRSVRAACSRAEVRLREAIALEAELRALPETAVPIDRTLAAARLEEWSDALERLRAESARGHRRRAAHTPAAAAPPAGGRIAAGPLGAIAGQVTDAATGDPIQDVFVDVRDDVGNFVTFAVTDAGGNYVTGPDLPTGTYFALTSAGQGYIDELYDDIPCQGFCDPTTGTPIAVTGGGTTSGIDFALDVGGAITGTATDAGTSAPIPDVLVIIWDDMGAIVDVTVTGASGVYTTFAGLTTGTYFATTLNQSSHLNELYDDIPCPFFGSCDATTGTPIAVTQGSTTSGIDFVMTPGGAIAGSIIEVGSGDPLPSGVTIFDDTGDFVTSGFTDPPGSYVSDDGLPTGTYFVRSDVAAPLFLNELYDDLPCPFFNCNPLTGTPVAVTVGTTTSGIDFALAEGGGIAGATVEEAGGGPISSVQVGLFDGAGAPLISMFSFNGSYESFSGIPAGTYYSRTLNGKFLGYADERYDELPCLQTCPVTLGTPITVTAGAVTAGVDFTLPVRPLFFDSLESGGLGYWSSVTGGVGCAHSICTTGGPLIAACDPCAVAICAVDPFCCNVGWDGLCVLEVTTVCGLECP